MPEETLSGIEIDKRSEIFSLRIPEITAHMIAVLSKSDKAKLNDAVLITIARILHESKFDAQLYLKETIE
jgi:hypothetical protein